MVQRFIAIFIAIILTMTGASAYTYYAPTQDTHRTINTYSNEYIHHNHYVNRHHIHTTHYRDYHYQRTQRHTPRHHNVRSVTVYRHHQPIILHETRHHPHRYALSKYTYW